MRVALVSFGLLAAGVLYGGYVNADENAFAPQQSSQALQWGSPRASAAAGQYLLADDQFSAARKMNGITRPASSTSATSASDSQSAAATPPTVELDDPSASDLPPSVMKQGSSSPAFQSPPTGAQPAVRMAVRGGVNASEINSSGNGSPTTSEPTGLKALQQRLTNMRKSSPGVASASSSPQPASPTVQQAISPRPTGVPSATATVVSVPSSNPSAPSATEIHVAARPDANSFAPSTPAQASTVRISDPTMDAPAMPAAPVVVGAAPVVAGPVAESHHNPLTQSDNLAATPTAAPPSSLSDTVDANILFSQQSPMLDVKTTGPRSINVGKESAYTVTIVNSGSSAVQDMMVSIKIPAWTDLVDTKATNGGARPGSSAAGEPLVWHIPRVEAHHKEQLVLKLVPRESRPFDLAVQWTFSPVASQAMVEVKEAKLAMSLAGPKEVVYGQTKVYKLSLSNSGTGDADNVVLFLSPLEGVSSTPTRHDIGTLRAGESKIVEVELTARQSGTLLMKAAAMADGNLRAEVNEEIVVHRPGLKLIASGPDAQYTGTAANYKIRVSNPGNATAENILLTAMLPVGAKYMSSSGGQFVPEQNKITWSISSLNPGSEQELEVHCTLGAPGANHLQVVGTAASDLTDSAAAITNVEALADLKLEVSDPAGPIPVGEETTYEIHLRNRGTKSAENVDIAGYFSSGVEPLTADGAAFSISTGQVVFRPIESIGPGSELVLRIKAKADKPGNHVFRAEVVCQQVGTKLASEDTTLYFSDADHGDAQTASRPNTNPAR